MAIRAPRRVRPDSYVAAVAHQRCVHGCEPGHTNAAVRQLRGFPRCSASRGGPSRRRGARHRTAPLLAIGHGASLARSGAHRHARQKSAHRQPRAERKLDVQAWRARWETFVLQVVESRLRGSRSRAGDRRQRQARHDLRHVRSVGSRSACRRGTGGPTCRSRKQRELYVAAGPAHAGRAGGEVSRHLHQRRSAGARPAGRARSSAASTQVLRRRSSS